MLLTPLLFILISLVPFTKCFSPSVWQCPRISHRQGAVEGDSSGPINGGEDASDFTTTTTTSSLPDDLLAKVDINEEDLLPQAPAVSFRKYLTMQEKRVVVTIRYSADAGWKPYVEYPHRAIATILPDPTTSRLFPAFF